jgi:hypothetical protein
MQYGNPVSECEGFGQIVGDKQHGPRHLQPKAAELPVQVGARDWIQRSEGLVHQHDRRIGGKGPRQSGALPLPAR